MTQRLYIEDIASRLEARPDVYVTAAAELLRSLAKGIDTTKQAKEDIGAAWVAGYYHAGYTHDGAYAVKTAEDFAEQWAAQPVGINGLTDAETSASMSVAGLSKPKVTQPAQPGWLPIESAPKDMASRLYRVNGFCVQGFVDAAGILCAQNDRQAWRKMHGKPTHWMPLPSRPAAPSTKDGQP